MFASPPFIINIFINDDTDNNGNNRYNEDNLHCDNGDKDDYHNDNYSNNTDHNNDDDDKEKYYDVDIMITILMVTILIIIRMNNVIKLIKVIKIMTTMWTMNWLRMTLRSVMQELQLAESRPDVGSSKNITGGLFTCNRTSDWFTSNISPGKVTEKL